MFSGDMGAVLAAAREAEALGLDGVFGFDHFFPPGGASDRPSLEVFTTLSAVGAVTSRIRVGTLVARTVLRPTGMLAKLAASVDLITGGRMILGLGTGDPIDDPEHEAFDFPKESVTERRAHLAETVEAIKALFDGTPYEGGRLTPRIEGPLLPPPAQPGGPPVWLGGLADDVVRMAGRCADGWNGWGLPPARFAQKVKLLYESAGEAERPRQPEPTWAGIVLIGENEAEAERLQAARRAKGMEEPAFTGSAGRFADHLGALADAGATWAILVLAGPRDRRALLAARVLPLLPA